MSLVAQLYDDITLSEAMKLSDSEARFLLEHAQFTIMRQAMTNPEFRKGLKTGLSPAVRAVRGEPEPGGQVGPPP